MFIEENKAMAQRIWKELLNEGKTEKINELMAIDYVYHGPGGHEIKGDRGHEEVYYLGSYELSQYPFHR